MKECSVCHFQNEDDSEFCKDCGSKLSQQVAVTAAPAPAAAPAAPDAAMAPPVAPVAPSQVTCPACQTLNEAGNNFCKSCGASLAAPTPAAEAPAAAAQAPAVAPAPAPATPAPQPAAAGPRLVVISEPGKGTVFALGKARIALGRTAEGNDISLPSDGFVSSKHAVLTQEGSDFFIEDQGSTNGTYKLLQGKVKLQPGDVIKVGDTNLEFQV